MGSLFLGCNGLGLEGDGKIVWKCKCPIPEDDRLFILEALEWIQATLGSEVSRHEIILPIQESFDFKFTGTEQDAIKVLEYVANRMDIEWNNIKLRFYNEAIDGEISAGIMAHNVEGTQLTAGKYVEYGDGEVEIWIEEKLLSNPMNLVATIAHELSHYLLLYKKKLGEDNEYITDLLTVIFGFGIFSANSSTVKMNSWMDGGSSGWRITGASGYLHPKQWGFSLACYYLKMKGDSDFDWLEYTEKEIQKEIKRSLKYLRSHTS